MKLESKTSPFRSIQVQGMNALSTKKIKRYFSYAGQVEDVKKLDESVIVKFKYHSFVENAHRLNGHIVDKEPIKIRNVSYATEDYFQKGSSKKQVSRTYKFKNAPLDLSKHWTQIMNTLQEIQNSKYKWLISQLFCFKLEQIMHNQIYRSNIKASFNEVKIKQLILNIQNCPQPYKSEKNQNVEVLELMIDHPEKLQYEGSYYSWVSDIDTRIRSKLKSISKHEEKLEQLRYLYHLLENNTFIIEEGAKIISNEREKNQLMNEKFEVKNSLKATIENQAQQMFSMKFIEERQEKNPQRCQFRSVDEEHPSKEIKVFSDCHFHEIPKIAQSFTFFHNPFDGCMGTVGSKHIFHKFLPYQSANYLLIHHSHMNRNKYTRLQFALRFLNCKGSVLKEDNHYKIYLHQKQIFQDKSNLRQINQFRLAKHTLVFEDLSNSEKVLYMIKQYTHYILTKAEDYFVENQNQQFADNQFIVVLVSEKQYELSYYENILNVINQGIAHIKKPKLFFISIRDEKGSFELNLVKKKKCQHYLQTYIDRLEGEMNQQSLQVRVQELLKEKPHEIVEISNLENYQEFVMKCLWNAYLQKRKAKIQNKR